MFSQEQKCSFGSVWQWNDMGHSSVNSDICRKHVGAWPLRLSEHCQELAREACLWQLYIRRLYYPTEDTMLEIGAWK